MQSNIFLLLGSNIGDPLTTLDNAISSIELAIGSIVQKSSRYKTQAWGKTTQPDFVNQVIQVETNLNPQHLLHSILTIERDLGRIRLEKWGPRTIDIDILFYGSMIITTSELEIPHPGIPARRFTLVPLVEVAPKLIHPILAKTVEQILDECKDDSAVQRI